MKLIVDHDSSRARYQNKSEFLIASLHLCGNTGTYMDSPLHRHRGATPAHTILLGAGIPICEHMTNLATLPSSGGRLHAVPIAWLGGATFPVRAYVQSSE